MILIGAKAKGERPSEGGNEETGRDKRLDYSTKARSSSSVTDSVGNFIAPNVAGTHAPRSRNDVLDLALHSRNDSPLLRYTHTPSRARESETAIMQADPASCSIWVIVAQARLGLHAR